MARLRPVALSRVQATITNKLSRTSQATRKIMKEGAEDIADLAKHLVRENSGQLRKAITVEKQRDSKNRLMMTVFVDLNTPAAYKTADGILRYRNFTVRRYAERMNTGRYGWGKKSKEKSSRYGGPRGIKRDRNRYVGDRFIVRAKDYYHPIIVKKMKMAIDEAL